MKHIIKTFAVTSAIAIVLNGCSNNKSIANQEDTPSKVGQSAQTHSTDNELNLDYQQYELANGLKVILHQDKSDPIVAMATVVHVGSNRELPGKTGFAHFFEHMSFNDSENVPKGSNRKLIPELGGTRNGGTWSDGTIYYEVVPKDAFDKLLWIDSDRLGYMINTVDQGTLEREKQVVKNEKRQRVDNRAYGHSSHVIKKALYPANHPYNWTVIGDLEDLQSATLDDVREFYEKFYIPANATLVIAGDIDIAETKQKVERWFGEIKAGTKMPSIKPQQVSLTESVKLYHLDNFAQLPELRLTFPTVEQYHTDSYALNALGNILSSGKNAVLYKTIVEQKKLAPSVSAYNNSEEVAGSFTISVRGNAGVKLDDVYQSIEEALTDFDNNGFSEKQLTQYKAESETSFYYSIESILDKALQLGIYNEYAGSPDFLKQDIANITSVTADDIRRVYKKYIKNKPAIITSFVPKDQQALIISGSKKAKVIEEVIKQGNEEEFVENDAIKYKKTPSKADRSEPALTELPMLSLPAIWQTKLTNGVNIYGIEQKELPLVNFSLRIDGGQLLDPADKSGTAYLMAQLLNEGTASKTPQQLEEAIGLLGASLSVNAGAESLEIKGRTLAKNFSKTMALLNEILLSPRWDTAEFERLKAARLTRIKQEQGNANLIAYNAFLKKLYGDKHAYGKPIGGIESSVSEITIDDLKAFYRHNLTPKNASFHVVGSVNAEQVETALNGLIKWQGEMVTLPKQPKFPTIDQPKLYFIDLPDAKQSAIYVGKTTIKGNDPEFYALEFANNRLGGGMSARLAQTLRIQKGYTYGAYSRVSPSLEHSPFIASSQVRSNVTLESLRIFKDLIGNYEATFKEDDLSVTKNMTIKGNARNFETLEQLLSLLQEKSRFNLDDNYIEQQQEYVQKVNLQTVKKTINKHLVEKNMIYLVVGDAKTQLSRMKELGYGEPIVLDIYGNEI